MRTREQHIYAYNGMTPAEFGARTGQKAQAVRNMIEAGWFGWTEDGLPECLDIGKVGAKTPTYRILPVALKRYYRERAATGKRKAS